MSVHLMTWNPTSKKQGEEVVMVLLVVNCNNKKYRNYQKNDSITRHDLLLQIWTIINM